MALPGGYIPGPQMGGGITPIYNQFSGNLAGYMDQNGSVTLQSSGLENFPQTYAEATASQGGGTSAAGGGTAATGASGAGAAQPAAFTGNYAAAPSYLNAGSAPTIQAGGTQTLYAPDGTALSAAETQQIMSLYQAYQGGNAQAGPVLSQWLSAKGFGPGQLETSISNMQQGTGPNAPAQNAVQPETAALQQIAGIDPASETLRTAVANSYLTPLQQAQTPSAAQFQSYLDLYKQIDPSGAAARQSLGDQVSSQLALGSQLDPVTARQVEQQTRLGQAARGNVYGTPQMVEEAMTTGQAGQALQQQRQQAALSYLTSGETLGDVGMNLYNTQQANLRANQQGALSYLGSGQTPYQTGASYVNQANQNAAMAAQGGPQYNPAALGASYGAAQIPQYGLDIGQQAQNWYNSLSAYSGGQGGSTPNKGAQAAAGALGGAASGAMTGAAAGPYGALIGAGVGAVAGGVKGYYS